MPRVSTNLQSAPMPGAVDRRAGGQARASGGPAAAQEPRLNVLLAAGSSFDRAVWRRALAQTHCVVEADGLERAKTALEEFDADVLVGDESLLKLDSRSPIGGDGVSAPRPAILMVCERDSDARDLPCECRFDDVIFAPVRTAELAWRIRTLVQTRRLVQDAGENIAARGEQARILNALLEFSATLVGSRTLEDALERTVRFAAETTASGRVIVWLPAKDSSDLEAAIVSGAPSERACVARVSRERGWVARVFRDGENIFLDQDQPIGTDDPLWGLITETPAAIVALRAADHVVGVLTLSERIGGRAFGPRDAACIEMLANSAGAVIAEILVQHDLDEARDAILLGLARLAERRDSDTGLHVERVTQTAICLACALRSEPACADAIDDPFLESLRRAAPLHDIGKVGIPDQILLKAGRLTPDEMATMRTHAQIGWDTLQFVVERAPRSPFLEMAAQIAHCHHERFDGGGYPCGLRADEIPLAARIVAVADVYDALRARRPYKEPLSHQEASKVIREGSGTQFDPRVVAAFERCQDEMARLSDALREEG